MANEFKIRKGLIVNGSGSTVLDIQGSQGQLFSVTDQLSGSLFSVNDISGVPILEVFSDDIINLGTFNAEAIKVSGSNAIITGSLLGTASYALTASHALNGGGGGGDTFPYTGSAEITGSLVMTGSIFSPLYSSPQTLTDSASVPTGYNAFTIGPVTNIEGLIEVEAGANFSVLDFVSSSYALNATFAQTSVSAVNATSASHASEVTNNNSSSGSIKFWNGSLAEYNVISASADPNTIYFTTE